MLTIAALYEQYKQEVFSYLISITHNQTLSEDLVSETFLGAIKGLPGFRGESEIRTWLFSIARYKWYEHLRKEQRDVSMEGMTEEYLSGFSSPEEELVQREASRRMLELLKREEERTKGIVVMRVKGYSFCEIAKKYSISEGSARVIDFRAKKKFKEILTKEGFINE